MRARLKARGISPLVPAGLHIGFLCFVRRVPTDAVRMRRAPKHAKQAGSAVAEGRGDALAARKKQRVRPIFGNRAENALICGICATFHACLGTCFGAATASWNVGPLADFLLAPL